MILRDYQQRCLDRLYLWWMQHPGNHEVPLLTVPTGGGKSIIIAELCRLLFDTWPDLHPRTVVLVPSKELAEQNAEKLVALLPSHISVGYYSASLGRKVPDADVIVATIGSIYKDAHLLGNIHCVVIDEAHLVSPNGAEAGRFRKFLTDLSTYCDYRVVGCTATPFRGNGVWLTEGDAPLFTGVACTVTITELLDANYLSPLVRPVDIKTRIDTAGIKTTSGDYNLGELSDRVDAYLPAAADEACALAAERKKWIAFCATVVNAQALCRLLNARGIQTAVVCGDTPTDERARSIADFRAGRIRCLVTVLALAVGFDVPDVDCILWLRPTQSPVLYVQGCGRGLRISPGKIDCLWLDFSDTTERMGPVDTIKGRSKRAKQDREAPYCVCPNCGEHVRPASALVCPSCGAVIRIEEEPEPIKASNAAILSRQIAPKINTYPVTKVSYSVHTKPGSPDSMRVDYWCEMRMVCSEWVCFEHQGFAREKSCQWWKKRTCDANSDFYSVLWGKNGEPWVFDHIGENGSTPHIPRLVYQAILCIQCAQKIDAENQTGHYRKFFDEPIAITINETGKYPEIIKFNWEPNRDTTRTDGNETSLAAVAATV